MTCQKIGYHGDKEDKTFSKKSLVKEIINCRLKWFNKQRNNVLMEIIFLLAILNKCFVRAKNSNINHINVFISFSEVVV